MKKVLIITYYWPPSGGAGVQRCLKFSKYLPQFHIEPLILTVEPEKASYPILDPSLEKDIEKELKVYKTRTKDNFRLYKRITGNKTLMHGGFTDETKKSITSLIFRFLRGNFFIPDPRRGWNKYAFVKACEIIEQENIQTIMTSSPPHSTQLIGLKLKKRYPRLRWIADIRDPWTDIFYYNKLYHTIIAKAIDKNYERKVLENADKIIVVSDSIKELFTRKVTRDLHDTITVIPNGFDHLDFKDTIVQKEGLFIITYTGTLATEYNITAFLNAMRNIVKTYNPKIIVRFVGSNREVFSQFNLEGLAENIEVVDYVPHSEAIKYISGSNLLLLIIPKKENNAGILTGKLFEYLAARKPILCLGPVHGDAGKIIQECKAGMICDYYDEKSIYNFLMQCIEKWKNNEPVLQQNDTFQKYSRKTLTSKLAEILNGIIK